MAYLQLSSGSTIATDAVNHWSQDRLAIMEDIPQGLANTSIIVRMSFEVRGKFPGIELHQITKPSFNAGAVSFTGP